MIPTSRGKGVTNCKTFLLYWRQGTRRTEIVNSSQFKHHVCNVNELSFIQHMIYSRSELPKNLSTNVTLDHVFYCHPCRCNVIKLTSAILEGLFRMLQYLYMYYILPYMCSPGNSHGFPR